MSLTTYNTIVKSAVDILESSTKESQKRMLYLLKLEQARSLARELDKSKPKVKKTDKEITQIMQTIRKSYGRK
ncbi:MAG: hypothetical protein LH473_01655 [Chitinophagales bacterium]|nr:hypothetical protein [Chitinophagales bacterium]